MEQRFESSVGKALELIRKHDLLRLGKHELARLTVVQRKVSMGQGPIEFGRVLMDILHELMESRMKPEGPENTDRVDWRRYILLREYIFHGRSWGQACEDLIVSQALFFNLKRQAIEYLANELWGEEQRAKQEILKIPSNIPSPIFDFIPRADRKGRDLVTVILAGLRKRPWVVSIRGYPGTGKTSLAIEAAWAAIRELFLEQVIWVTIKRQGAKVSDLLSYIYDTIAKERGNRSVLATEDLDEKRQIALDLLDQVKCLLVIDNTEVLPNEQHEGIIGLIRDLTTLSTCILLVSREMKRKAELEPVVNLEGMQKDEAKEFLRRRSEEQSVDLSEEETLYLWRATSGTPTAMLWALGMMVKYGLLAEEVLKPDIPAMPDLLDFLLRDSYEKLNVSEEKVLNVMGLFSVPVSWAIIGAASGLMENPTQLRIALGNLYSRFLVNKDDENRYSILPLTQMFLEGRAQMPDAKLGEQSLMEFKADAYRRLADYYVAKLKASDPYGRLKCVKEQRENTVRVLKWCYENNNYQRITDLVFYIGRALGDLGYWQDRIIWGRQAVEAAEKIGDLKRVAWHKIYDIGWTHLYRAEYKEAEEITRQGLAEAQKLSHFEAEAVAWRNLGVIAFHRNEHKIAEEYLERSLQITKTKDVPEMIATSQTTLGLVKIQLEEMSEARELFEQAYSVRHALGEPCAEATSLSQLALVASKEGDENEALKLLSRGLAVASTIPKPAAAYGYVLRMRGIIMKDQGKVEEARESFEESLEIYTKLGARFKADEVESLLSRLKKQ